MAGKYGLKSGKACRDFLCPTNADLRYNFTKDPYRLHKKSFAVYAMGEMVLRRLGHGDIISADINIRDLEKFKVEVVMFLAKRMAVYAIAPQRYAHNPSNMVASSVNAFSGRIQRFRYGHKLVSKQKRLISKAKLGDLIAELCDNSYLWDLAEKYVESYKWRLKHGYCELI